MNATSVDFYISPLPATDQFKGGYPATFAAIKSPVLMLHGDYDPHPGTMIRDSLLPYLPYLGYHELVKCGHSSWRERAVRDEFFNRVQRWLGKHLSMGESP